jgi:hypothetical protein
VCVCVCVCEQILSGKQKQKDWVMAQVIETPSSISVTEEGGGVNAYLNT